LGITLDREGTQVLIYMDQIVKCTVIKTNQPKKITKIVGGWRDFCRI